MIQTQYNHARLLGSIICLSPLDVPHLDTMSEFEHQRCLIETLEKYSNQGLFRKTVFRMTSCRGPMPLVPNEWIFRCLQHLYFADDARPLEKLGSFFWNTTVCRLLTVLNKVPEWDSNGCSLRYLVESRNQVLCHLLLNEVCEYYLVKANLPLLATDAHFRESDRVHRLSIQAKRLLSGHLSQVVFNNPDDLGQIKHFYATPN